MNEHRSYCPINLMLEVFGDKWSLVIIRDIMFAGKRHFRELLQSEEQIASNILTDRLVMLEKEGIITKRTDPSHKQKFIYNLTIKGIDLLPVILEMGRWSLKYKPVDLQKHKHAVDLVNAGEPMMNAVRENLIREHL